MKASRRQKRIAYFLSRGCRQAETRSTKYFALDNPEGTSKLWLGQSAVRKGRTAGDSSPVYSASQKAALDTLAAEVWLGLTAEQQESIVERFPDKKRRQRRSSTSALRDRAIDDGRRGIR